MIAQAHLAWQKQPVLVAVCGVYLLATVGCCVGVCLTTAPSVMGTIPDPDALLRMWGQTEPQMPFATREETEEVTHLWWAVGEEYAEAHRRRVNLEDAWTVQAWEPLVTRDAKRLSVKHGRDEAFWRALLWERCGELAWNHRGLRGWTNTYYWTGPFDGSAGIMLQCDWLACNTFRETERG